MDPTTLLRRVLSDIAGFQANTTDLNREDVVEDLRDLASWIEEGGFLPQVGITKDLGFDVDIKTRS